MDELAIAQAIVDILRSMGLWPDTSGAPKPAIEYDEGQVSMDTYKARFDLEGNKDSLPILHAALDHISSQIIDAKSDILSAVGSPAQVLDPPTWWIEPPTPPTPPTPSENAGGVWDSVLDEGVTAGVALRQAGALAYNINIGAALPIMNPPNFQMTGQWAHIRQDVAMQFGQPAPDYSDIRPDDTVLSWLQRTDTNLTWTQGYDGLPHARAGGPSSYGHNYEITPTFTSFPLSPTSTPPPPVLEIPPAAPVWPGLANVTLGTPVALEDGLVVSGPLDGVLVDVTGHPSGAGKYAFGGLASWRYLGGICFRTDDGQAEWPIQMGPESGILTPRSMKRAASAVVRLNGGFTGTVTPWTITTGG